MASSSIRNVVLFTALLGGIAALTPSCAENNETIFVRQMQAVVPSDCTFKNDPTGLAITAGVLDVAVGSSYVGFPLVGNQLVSRGDPKTSKAESMRVQIQGAEVRIIDLESGGVDGPFSVIATGIADPTLSADPGYGASAIELIPGSIARKFVARAKVRPVSVTAAFKVFGKTLGGTDVTTAEYQFPITICFGCLVDFSGNVSDPAVTSPARNCRASIKDGDVVKFCRAGQDLPYDCRLCQNLNTCTLCATPADCPEGGAGVACIGGRCTPP